MAKHFRIERHSGADKEFRILGPDFDLIVDYDDVDHKFQDRMAKRVVKLLNEYWEEKDSPWRTAQFQPMRIG